MFPGSHVTHALAGLRPRFPSLDLRKTLSGLGFKEVKVSRYAFLAFIRCDGPQTSLEILYEWDKHTYYTGKIGCDLCKLYFTKYPDSLKRHISKCKKGRRGLKRKRRATNLYTP